MNIFLTEVGYFGNYILLIAVIIEIYARHKYKNIVYVYIIIAQLFNEIINRLLKNIIKQPRPIGYEYVNTWDMHKPGEYGMPSGHAQTVFTETSFLIFFSNNIKIKIFAVIQSLLTVYQRWYYKKHTVAQLIAGACIGILLGQVYYKIFKINESKITKVK